MKFFLKHLQHYVPLVGMLVAGVIGFVVFSYDKTFQTVIVVSMAVGYVVWGLIHHHMHRDLHASVIVEYLAIASLGAVIVISLIFIA